MTPYLWFLVIIALVIGISWVCLLIFVDPVEDEDEEKLPWRVKYWAIVIITMLFLFLLLRCQPNYQSSVYDVEEITGAAVVYPRDYPRARIYPASDGVMVIDIDQGPPADFSKAFFGDGSNESEFSVDWIEP